MAHKSWVEKALTPMNICILSSYCFLGYLQCVAVLRVDGKRLYMCERGIFLGGGGRGVRPGSLKIDVSR